MNYKGRVIINLDGRQGGTVKNAVITRGRISIDWLEEGEAGHLEGVSLDGIRFRGKYGYGSDNSKHKFDLKLYKAKKEILLYGTWREGVEEGVWGFQLSQVQRKTPSTKETVASPASKKLKSPRKAAFVAESVRNDSKSDLLASVQVPDELANVRHACKYFDRKKWVLTSKRGREIARFDTESSLESWWEAFQKRKGRDPLPLKRLQTPPSRPHIERKKRRKGLGAVRMPPEEIRETKVATQKEFAYTGKPTADYLNPPSEKYDMPEYDLR